jgi:hypothetical protein
MPSAARSTGASPRAAQVSSVLVFLSLFSFASIRFSFVSVHFLFYRFRSFSFSALLCISSDNRFRQVYSTPPLGTNNSGTKSNTPVSPLTRQADPQRSRSYPNRRAPLPAPGPAAFRPVHNAPCRLAMPHSNAILALLTKDRSEQRRALQSCLIAQ